MPRDRKHYLTEIGLQEDVLISGASVTNIADAGSGTIGKAYVSNVGISSRLTLDADLFPDPSI